MSHGVLQLKSAGGIDEWTKKRLAPYQLRPEFKGNSEPEEPERIFRTSGNVQVGTTADPEFALPKPTFSSVSSIAPDIYNTTKSIREIFSENTKVAAIIPRDIVYRLSSRILIGQQGYQREMHQNIDTLFCSAKDQVFEDGMESEFSRNLAHIVNKYKSDAVKSIHALINEEKGNAEVLSEALRWLGHMEDPNTHNERRWLLESCLSSPSAIIRDGAILGLAFLNDHRSIASLEKAIQKETLEELKKDMMQIIKELQRTTE